LKADNVTPRLRTGPRFYAGVVFFVLFLTGPLFIPLVYLLPIPLGWKAGISAGLAIGLPEVFAVIAIALMGRENFEALLQPFKRLLDRISPPRVGRRRYAIGLAMLLLPVAEAAVFLHSDDWRELFADHYLVRAIVWNVLILGSFIVLGGDFRTKIRALFIRQARVQFPVSASELPHADECFHQPRYTAHGQW